MRRPTIKEKVPSYLHPFIAEQDPRLYSAIDHAGWRYIMRVSKAFFAEHAHQKYLNGLKETGIETDRIPLIEDMDSRLERFGWRACAIVGFIPPAAFMEFLSLGILPIACDMRRLEHLAYTPAPDIVHEAAGHAPIIADQEYADYLYEYGEIARKVVFSDQDLAVYEAIRCLSDTKEHASSTKQDIASAQKRLDEAAARVDYVSEATLLSRMGWWTIEYGLVGDIKRPKIYGAGLLSSVSESYHCLRDEVKKLPFSVDCINVSYDITKPQPQLFVTPDFQALKAGLAEFASRLAFRRGGMYGLEVAKKSKTVNTVELDTGLQIGGVVDEIILSHGEPCYLRFSGPSQLAVGDHQLEGHGPAYHKEGFGTALGRLKDSSKSLTDYTESELQALKGRLEFSSGIVVEGRFRGARGEQGKNLALAFTDCTVRIGDRVLFQPEWGTYDLAVGERVVSVFGGAPDRGRYLEETGGFSQKPAHQTSNLAPGREALVSLYARVREIRDSGKKDMRALGEIARELEAKYPGDWLLRLELLEFDLGGEWDKRIRKDLELISGRSAETRELIERGLALL